MARPRRKGCGGDDMPVFEVDGLPYIDAGLAGATDLPRLSRMQVWQQQAHRFCSAVGCRRQGDL